MSREYDMVIIGAGPAGLTLATLLTRLDYHVKIIDKRSKPTQKGHADGIQPYTLSLLKIMGLKRAIMANDPGRIYQVAFWDSQPGGGGIQRKSMETSCPAEIEARYPFTTTLHQGYIEKMFIDDMERKGVKVQRPWTISGFENEGEGEDFPVRVELEQMEGIKKMVVRTKYMFDAEGAHSFVRERLGIHMVRKKGESYLWGVIDGAVKTDFPDVKIKCTVQSDHGSLMLIPRENNLVRIYAQLPTHIEEKVRMKQATEEEVEEAVQDAAKKILQPYYIEWDSVEWSSPYVIGQGIAEKYTLDHRIFLGGDCCHTHSPKAGQGMNTAFHDALNLAWKIHHVESGFAHRRLLRTYESERKFIAETLIDFDAKYATLFSQRSHSFSSSSTATSSKQASSPPEEAEEGPYEFLSVFKKNQLFTTGYGIIYPSPTPRPPSLSNNSLLYLSNPRPGAPLPRTTVTRLSDGRPIHLEEAVPFNGAFRILIFVGATEVTTALKSFCHHLKRSDDLFARSYISEPSELRLGKLQPKFCSFSLIFTSLPSPITSAPPALQVPSMDGLSPMLSYNKDQFFRDDVPAPTKDQAHKKMGLLLKSKEGGIVLLRPDGHVACALPLVVGSGTADALLNYFRKAGYYFRGDAVDEN